MTGGFHVKQIRMLDWLVATVILAAVIVAVAPQQIGVTAYKLSLVCLAAVAGYRLDRSLFPYGRPDDLLMERSDVLVAGAMLRRAIIVAACVIGVSLGA